MGPGAGYPKVTNIASDSATVQVMVTESCLVSWAVTLSDFREVSITDLVFPTALVNSGDVVRLCRPEPLLSARVHFPSVGSPAILRPTGRTPSSCGKPQRRLAARCCYSLLCIRPLLGPKGECCCAVRAARTGAPGGFRAVRA